MPSVRKIFETAEEAVAYETKFLTKVNAQHNDKWLNRHNGRTDFIGPHTHSEVAREKIRSKIKGIKRSEETKAKMRAKAKEREAKRRAEGWTMPDEARDKQSAYARNKVHSAERNAKMASSKRGAKRQYLPDGSFIMVHIDQ